ncbi:hypothetical protein KFL_001120010 [Klebsormidium nitens]|uniref:Condensin-2 complex subunit G2 n=1 Tax=Klebsormidium nitens TaxID=105231 RepID=A0A1Y1I0Z2_KLENI|nr:hypothetical protein KFL_001120010 [Klebsormidium nitens]|eukprot:GAQ82457.1 hypothetical protein KFL_001120010 [Klebsormidium nitens]
MRPVEAFLEALENDRWNEVLDVVNRHHLRKDDLNIEEFLQTLPKKCRPRLCDALSAKATKLIGQFLELLEKGEQEESAETEERDESENERLSLYTDLRALVLLIRASLDDCFEGPSSGKLLPAVEAIHSVLLGLEEDASLQDSAARLCEAWWAQNLPGREKIMAQTIPYLVARALDNGKTADVHRVFAVRQAVPMFDFADESIESLKKLLLRATFAPIFLKAAEGRRFITYLCGLNVGMVREIFAIVRNQIPSGRKSILETYGDILFKAWKVASGPCLYELEYNCVQRLAEACLYASTPGLAANIRRVLGGFNSQKKQRGVDELLLRLYEPLLFRALQVANASVRHNALLLFVDVFPLQNPDAPHDQTDALLQKQVGLLDKLLSDPAPTVRASAVEGVCRILRVFWELIPSPTTAKLIARLVEELSYDGASSAVRCAVLDGVTYLLHNPLSHPLVQAVLPRLAPMINDSVPKVRLASVDLLLAVRNIKALDKLDERSNLEALLKSLAMAEAPMAKKLTRLLIRSYVPADAPASVAAERVLDLVKENATAGAQLCRHMQESGVPSDTALHIGSHLCATVTLSSVASGPVNGKRTSRSRVSKRKAGTDITNGASAEAESAVLSVEQQEGILEAVVALTKGALEQRIEMDLLVDALPSSLLIQLLDKAASGCARSSVLRLAGLLPPSETPALIQHCGKRLVSSVTSETDPAACEEIRAILFFIVSWGGLPDLSGAMSAAIAAESSSPPSPTEPTPLKGKKRGRKKGVTAAQTGDGNSSAGGATMAPGAAARYVELLLEDEATRAVLLDDPDSVNALFDALRDAVQLALQGTSSSPDLPVTIRAYAKLVILWAAHSQTYSDSSDGTDSEAWATAASAFHELVSWSHSALAAVGSDVESVPVSGDTPQPKRTRSRTEETRGGPEGGHVALDDALLTVLALCGDAVALGLLPAIGVDDAPLPLHFAAAFVRHVYGRARTSKATDGPKRAQAPDVRGLLKSVLSHAAKLAHEWPENHRDEKADLADAILTVAATTFIESSADTCPTPAKTFPGTPTIQAGSASAGKRSSPVIAFGHRVNSPGSAKKSPNAEKEQIGRVSVIPDETLADVATAVLKPWLGELFVLAVEHLPGLAHSGETAEEGGTEEGNGTAERSGMEGPGEWFGRLMEGWGPEQRGGEPGELGAGDDGARHLRTRGKESAGPTEGAESARETSQDEQHASFEDDEFSAPLLLQSLLALATKSGGPVRSCLADATAAALVKCVEGGAIDKALRAVQVLTRLSGASIQRSGPATQPLSPSVSMALERLLKSPLLATPNSEALKKLSSTLQGIVSNSAAGEPAPAMPAFQWGSSW